MRGCNHSLNILAGQLERLLLDSFPNSAATNALNADFHRLGSTTWQSRVDFLQIRTELAASNPGYFGADSPEILRFTASLNRVAHLGAFSTNFTLACHDSEILQNCLNSYLLEATQYNKRSRPGKAAKWGA